MALNDRVDKSLLPAKAERLIRNGLAPHGAFTRAVARALNHLLARHGTIIPPVDAGGVVRDTASELALWRTRYHAGPVQTKLVSRVHLGPCPVTTGNPKWYVKIDGVSQGDHFHNIRSASSIDGVSFVRENEYTVTPNATHTVELWTKDRCLVHQWYLREKERETLTVGTDASVADYSNLLVNGPVLDTEVASVFACAYAIWRNLRGYHVNWNVADPASPISVTSTSETFLWDSAGNIKVICPTQYRQSYAASYASTPDRIPVVLWAYAARTAGAGNVLVRYNGALGNSADITINGAAGFYTQTDYIKAQAGGDAIKFGYRVSAGGTTGSLYAVGLYPLVPT